MVSDTSEVESTQDEERKFKFQKLSEKDLGKIKNHYSLFAQSYLVEKEILLEAGEYLLIIATQSPNIYGEFSLSLLSDFPINLHKIAPPSTNNVAESAPTSPETKNQNEGMEDFDDCFEGDFELKFDNTPKGGAEEIEDWDMEIGDEFNFDEPAKEETASTNKNSPQKESKPKEKEIEIFDDDFSDDFSFGDEKISTISSPSPKSLPKSPKIEPLKLAGTGSVMTKNFFELVKTKNFGEVKKLLDTKSVNVNEKQEDSGKTAFLLAAEVGDIKIGNLLIDNQCDLGELDNQQHSFIIKALLSGHISFVRFFFMDVNAIYPVIRTVSNFDVSSVFMELNPNFEEFYLEFSDFNKLNEEKNQFKSQLICKKQNLLQIAEFLFKFNDSFCILQILFQNDKILSLFVILNEEQKPYSDYPQILYRCICDFLKYLVPMVGYLSPLNKLNFSEINLIYLRNEELAWFLGCIKNSHKFSADGSAANLNARINFVQADHEKGIYSKLYSILDFISTLQVSVFDFSSSSLSASFSLSVNIYNFKGFLPFVLSTHSLLQSGLYFLPPSLPLFPSSFLH